MKKFAYMLLIFVWIALSILLPGCSPPGGSPPASPDSSALASSAAQEGSSGALSSPALSEGGISSGAASPAAPLPEPDPGASGSASSRSISVTVQRENQQTGVVTKTFTDPSVAERIAGYFSGLSESPIEMAPNTGGTVFTVSIHNGAAVSCYRFHAPKGNTLYCKDLASDEWTSLTGWLIVPDPDAYSDIDSLFSEVDQPDEPAKILLSRAEIDGGIHMLEVHDAGDKARILAYVDGMRESGYTTENTPPGGGQIIHVEIRRSGKTEQYAFSSQAADGGTLVKDLTRSDKGQWMLVEDGAFEDLSSLLALQGGAAKRLYAVDTANYLMAEIVEPSALSEIVAALEQRDARQSEPNGSAFLLFQGDEKEYHYLTAGVDDLALTQRCTAALESETLHPSWLIHFNPGRMVEAAGMNGNTADKAQLQRLADFLRREITVSGAGTVSDGPINPGSASDHFAFTIIFDNGVFYSITGSACSDGSGAVAIYTSDLNKAACYALDPGVVQTALSFCESFPPA